MCEEKKNFEILRGNHVHNYGFPYLIIACDGYDQNAYKNSIEYFLFFDGNHEKILALRLNCDLQDKETLNRLKIVDGDYLQYEIRQLAHAHLRSFCESNFLETGKQICLDYEINFQPIDVLHEFTRLFFYEKHRSILQKIAENSQCRDLSDFINNNLKLPTIFTVEKINM